MTRQSSVDKFLQHKTLAIVGVSRSGKKFGNYILKELGKKGVELLVIHPDVSEIQGHKCIKTISDLPNEIKGLIVSVPPEQTEKIVIQAKEAGINDIWMQQGAASTQAVKFCQENGINVVNDECILMFVEPTGFHKFHCWLWDLLGKLPKQTE